LINNRQGGRRRGRGGQRGQNLGGQPGNRQDNRQRGNAAQLLEKYKSMARDAQLAGDRVQSEYYLQYADHYFRVLGESRARFEDQSPRRHRDDEADEDGESRSSDHEPGFHHSEEELAEASEDEGPVEERQPRGERFNRPGRQRRPDRDERAGRDATRSSEPEREREDSDRLNGDGETIPFDVLPPAIGRDDDSEEAERAEPRPRKRSRAARPAADGDDEIAPAA
jgi:hypothetical protein